MSPLQATNVALVAYESAMRVGDLPAAAAARAVFLRMMVGAA